MELAQETLDISLMLGTGIMVCFFEFSVFDKCFAVLAPVFGLLKQVSDIAKITGAGGEDERWTSSILTFCCPELKGSVPADTESKVWRLH